MNTIIMLTMNFSSVEILNPISQSSENRWSNVGNKHETYHFTYSNYDLTDLNHYAQSINLYLNRQFFGIDIYLKWSILWLIKVLISKLLINKSTVCITSKFIDRIIRCYQVLTIKIRVPEGLTIHTSKHCSPLCESIIILNHN
jgi:hypothetical protein